MIRGIKTEGLPMAILGAAAAGGFAAITLAFIFRGKGIGKNKTRVDFASYKAKELQKRGHYSKIVQ